MKKFTHAELAAAQERGDWALLWQQAMPLVKLTVGRMGRSGAVRGRPARPGTRDDDLVQQGMLIAGEAMRTWRPLECAFSTHVANAVRWGLLESLSLAHNHGIGSKHQRPAVFNTSDSRDGLYGFHSADYDDGDEDDDGSFDAALTYEGVYRPSGQYDGGGTAPGGFGSPEDEAARVETVVRVRVAALALCDANEREVVGAVLDGEQVDAYAQRKGIPKRTVRNWLQNARTKMAAQLR